VSEIYETRSKYYKVIKDLNVNTVLFCLLTLMISFEILYLEVQCLHIKYLICRLKQKHSHLLYSGKITFVSLFYTKLEFYQGSH